MKFDVHKCTGCGVYSEELVAGLCVTCEIDMEKDDEEVLDEIYNPKDEEPLDYDYEILYEDEAYDHPPMCSCRYCDTYDPDWELEYYDI